MSRKLTKSEKAAIKPHFEEINRLYTKLGKSETVDEFKANLLNLHNLGNREPIELTRLYRAILLEISRGSS